MLWKTIEVRNILCEAVTLFCKTREALCGTRIWTSLEPPANYVCGTPSGPIVNPQLWEVFIEVVRIK